MWYVLAPTGLALTGIGNATVKRGTLANEGAATAGASPSTAAPGNASIPAPTAPLRSNCRLLIRLFVMACAPFPSTPKTANRPPQRSGSRLHHWLFPSQVPAIEG